MSLDRPEIAALTAELAALRRRVRTLTRALTASIALAAGAAALFAAAPLQSQASRITAQEITIVDSSGKARGTWAGDTGIVLSNSALTLNNALGERRLLVNVADDEPTVYFLDKAGKTRMYFDVSAAGAARLGMSDSQLKQRVFLTVDDQRNPALILNDEAGNRRMVLNVEKDEPIHAFYDAKGNLRMYANGGTFPRLMMYDAQAKQRNILAVDNNGLPFMAMTDPSERRRLLINVENDAASVFFKNADGTDLARLPAPAGR